MDSVLPLSLEVPDGVCPQSFGADGQQWMVLPALLHHSSMNPLQQPLSKAATLWDRQH